MERALGNFFGSLGLIKQHELPLAAFLMVCAVDLRVVQRWGDISMFNLGWCMVYLVLAGQFRHFSCWRFMNSNCREVGRI